MFPSGLLSASLTRLGPGARPMKAELTAEIINGNTSGWVSQGVNAVSATATFTVPQAVTCQSDQVGYNVNSFWTGIYGPNSGGATSIAQAGFNISCGTDGQTFYIPWFIGNAVAPTSSYISELVEPGDTFSSTIFATDDNGDYVMQLQDVTQGWSQDGYVSDGPITSLGASASFSGETFYGGVYFPPVLVTGATVNDIPIGQADPLGYIEDPADYFGGAGTAALAPSPIDATGEDFTLAWDSPTVQPVNPLLPQGVTPRIAD
jgi:hypothetical protein